MKDSIAYVLLWICQTFQKRYSIEHLRKTASVINWDIQFSINFIKSNDEIERILVKQQYIQYLVKICP